MLLTLKPVIYAANVADSDLATGNAMSKIVFDFAAAEGNTCVLVSAQVQIKCFIATPPPPGYRPCAECGSYSIQQGQTIQIEASQYLFSNGQGGLDITITDLDGDMVRIQLRVTTEDPDSASVAVAVSM